MDERSNVWIVVVLAALIIFVAWRATPPEKMAESDNWLDKIVSLTSPSDATPPDVFGPLDGWLRKITGLSLTQMLFAAWKLMAWLIRWSLAVAWTIFGWVSRVGSG